MSEGRVDPVFSLMDEPRIRHITGIQIHQLTVHPNVERPKLLRARSTSRGSLENSTIPNGSSSRHGRRSSFGTNGIIDEDKPLSSSPDTSSFLRRHVRSTSGSLPPSNPLSTRVRTGSDASATSATQSVTRARASTLTAAEIHTTAEEQKELGDFVRHQLARCFVALYAPPQRIAMVSSHMARSASSSSPTVDHRPKSSRQTVSHSPSSTSLKLSRTPPASTPNQRKQIDKVPFFLSTVHRPSTQPRFLGLDAQADFAPWLDVAEAAAGEVEVEVWVEVLDVGQDRPSWRRLKGVGGRVAFKDLIVKDSQTPPLPDNTLLFTFTSHPNSTFYLPTTTSTVPPPNGTALEPEAAEDRKRRIAHGRDIVRSAVERSLRETRMKKGPGVGALHQFVNLQAVLADTRRGVEEVRVKIDTLLASPQDIKMPQRDVAERRARIKWLKCQITEVKRSADESRARMILFSHTLDERRRALERAAEAEELLRGQCDDLQSGIADKIDENKALQPAIHAKRAHLTQTLDALFPIAPLDPASLLYTILDVPLPIPTGPKDPAPPLSVPANLLPEGVVKVDEESTATALGYAAMVVQLLGTVTDRQAPYPVTCAGSRSLVKDLVSVMQGPRSFPLYAKGVERYRYEYAVFLLNKDIEMLMLDCNIRILDLRHTLPNLKNLLLTLSSPQPLPTFSQSLNNTRPNSRVGFQPSKSNATQSQIGLGIGSSPLARTRGLMNPSEVDQASVSDGNLEKEVAAAVEHVSGYAAT